MSTPRRGPASIARGAGVTGALVVAGAFFAAAAPAQAACHGSTPSSSSYSDPADGTSGFAPNVGTVAVALDDACNLTVDPGIADRLLPNQSVLTYIDADGDATTGDPLFDGADVLVGIAGGAQRASAPLRAVWDGNDFRFRGTTPVGTGTPTGGFTATLDRLGIESNATIRVTVVSGYVRGDVENQDFAPESPDEALLLPIAFAAAPVPGTVATPITRPAPSARPTPAAQPAPAPQAKPSAPKVQPQRCRVPQTKGLTVAKARAKLKAAGCSVATKTTRATSAKVRSGRVVRTSVSAGTRTTKRVQLVVSRGAAKTRAKATR